MQRNARVGGFAMIALGIIGTAISLAASNIVTTGASVLLANVGAFTLIGQ